jgi:transposase
VQILDFQLDGTWLKYASIENVGKPALHIAQDFSSSCLMMIGHGDQVALIFNLADSDRCRSGRDVIFQDIFENRPKILMQAGKGRLTLSI